MPGINTNKGHGLFQVGTNLNRLPVALTDENLISAFDYQNGITKDVSDLISLIVPYKVDATIGSLANLVQATSTKQPKLTADGIHFNFDSSDDKLVSSAFTYNQPTTQYFVLRDNVYGTDRRFTDGISGNKTLLGWNTGLFAVFGGSAFSTGSKNVRQNSLVVICVVFDGANSELIINKTAKVTGSWGTTAPGGYTIGNRGDATAAGENFILRDAVYRRGHDSDDVKYEMIEYLRRKNSIKEILILGDSTAAYSYSQNSIQSYLNFRGSMFDVSVGSSPIAEQKTYMLSVANNKTNAVIIMVGLNNLTVTTPQIIAAYQDLVDSTRALIGSSNKIVICTMTPCNLSSDQQYIDLNEAIRGNGATPITGVDARIDTTLTVLNAGDGTLSPTYDIGDGLHENNAGRQIIAALWDAKLTELGIS